MANGEAKAMEIKTCIVRDIDKTWIIYILGVECYGKPIKVKLLSYLTVRQWKTTCAQVYHGAYVC